MAKAQVISFYDISAWIILVLGMAIWLIILRSENTGHAYKVEDRVQKLNKEEVFINILRSSRNNMTVADTMIQAYKKGEMSDFQEDFNILLKDYYGREVCWALFIDGKSAAENSCISKDRLMDATIFLPSERALETRLIIKGYK